MEIYITRHGESEHNVLGIIGGDSSITEEGKKYAKHLGDFFKAKDVTTFTSSLKRTKETAQFLSGKKIVCKNLDEIFSGIYDDWNEEKIKRECSEEFITRNSDKLNNSYPNGESYRDLQKRVVQTLTNIEITDGVLLIIAHKAVCRVLHSYFTKTPIDVNRPVKLHTLYKFDKKSNDFISHSVDL